MMNGSQTHGPPLAHPQQREPHAAFAQQRLCAMLAAALLTGLAGLSNASAASDAPAAQATIPPGSDDERRAAALAAADELQAKMAAIDEQYRKLIEKVAEVEVQRRELEQTLAKVRDLESYRGGADTAGAPDQVGAEQKAEKEAAENQRPEIPRVSPDVGGVLTPKGRLVLEPSFQYVYSSFSTVDIDGVTVVPAVLIGLINIEDADRDTYIPSLTARYGITNRLEFETRVPYIVRRDSTRGREFLGDPGTPPGQVTSEERFFRADASDLGDIEFGLRYQFPRSRPDWPFLTGNLRVKSNTGTDPYEQFLDAHRAGTPITASDLATGSGFWSISPSVTFLYPSDPVVFFGNLGYLWTVEDNKGSALGPQPPNPEDDPELLPYEDVDPGDAIRLSVGMGFGLNDRSSFSLGYSLDIYSKTNVSGFPDESLNGSDFTVGKFTIGYSLKIGDGQPFNLAIGIGATDDAPDTDITFRMPFNFFN